MAELSFTNKEAQKKEQIEAFLALTPSERFTQFLKMSEAYAKFATIPKKINPNNLILERKPKK